jgi:hypothetical protein
MRMWRAKYTSDQRAREALTMIDQERRKQDTTTPIVRCGGAGALWRVLDVEGQLPLLVVLEPVDPHEPPPSMVIYEMPQPQGSVG